MRDVVLVILPLGVGFCLGAFVEAAGWLRSARLLLAAPVVAGLVVCVTILVVGIVSGRAPANPHNPNPLLLQWGVTTCMFAPAIFIEGALPSILGAGAGQLLRRLLW